MKINPEIKSLLNQQKAKFHPLESNETYSKIEVVHGLILPDNTKLLEMRGVSSAVMSVYTEQLQAGTFHVKGEWVFRPDLESIYGERPYRPRRG